MDSEEFIQGVELVTNLLGYWPSFHDSEVISFVAERELPFRHDATLARLAIHFRSYVSKGEGTSQCESILDHSIIIQLRFKEACDFDLSGFNHQNVINGIDIKPSQEDTSGGLDVFIDPIWGFGGSLRCKSVEVECVKILEHE
jgi:hypothetical protein